MSFGPGNIEKLADAYTAAWNTGSPQKVAGFFAEDGEIVINRGEPWRGRSAIAEMAAGFFADVPDMNLVCVGSVTGPHDDWLSSTVVSSRATPSRVTFTPNRRRIAVARRVARGGAQCRPLDSGGT